MMLLPLVQGQESDAHPVAFVATAGGRVNSKVSATGLVPAAAIDSVNWL